MLIALFFQCVCSCVKNKAYIQRVLQECKQNNRIMYVLLMRRKTVQSSMNSIWIELHVS